MPALAPPGIILDKKSLKEVELLMKSASEVQLPENDFDDYEIKGGLHLSYLNIHMIYYTSNCIVQVDCSIARPKLINIWPGFDASHCVHYGAVKLINISVYAVKNLNDFETFKLMEQFPDVNEEDITSLLV